MLTTSKQLEVNSIAVHPKNPLTVLIGTNNYGVMISRDGGKTFVPSNGGYSGRFANFILSDREQTGRVYATTINTATGGGFFFVSNDAGQTWQPSTRNMPQRLIGYSILQDEKDGNLLYLASNYGIYRSLDRGASWSPLIAPKPQPEAKPARTRRGKAAATITPKLPATASAAAKSKADETVLRAQKALNASGYKVGTPDGLMGKATIAGIRGYQADRGIAVSGKLDSSTLVSLGIQLSGTVSQDGQQAGSGAIYLTDTVNSLVSTHDENGRPGMLAATNAGLYRTYDPAAGWERVVIAGNYDQKITTLSTSALSPKTIWAGTSVSGLLVSRDGGATWQQAEGVPTDAPISAIKQDPQSPSRIYVGTKQTFYVSYDDGQKWTRRGGDLPYGEFPTIVINPRNTNEVFVGNAFGNVGGVFHSTDAGLTWSRVDPKDSLLPSKRIWALEFDSNDPGKLFVGSTSAGVYVADRPAVAAATGSN
jgi:photosystem II stability/assembly factor-like uncharacterized protein